MGSKTSVPDVLAPVNLDEVQEAAETVKAEETQAPEKDEEIDEEPEDDADEEEDEASRMADRRGAALVLFLSGCYVPLLFPVCFCSFSIYNKV